MLYWRFCLKDSSKMCYYAHWNSDITPSSEFQWFLNFVVVHSEIYM
uniref:Uncharacterized protein n=1 Tax=Arundo donax TaxID=35708 RepID=A0A0A8ZHQ2_ARUDO